MQLKRSMDLTPYDIPRIECPFLAAFETRDRIHAGQFSDQELRQLLRLQPYDRADLCELAANLVYTGEAFLVHGPLDEDPLSPVVAWRTNPQLPQGGEWQPTSPLPFSLDDPLQDLNAAQLTPQDIKRGPFFPGSGLLSTHQGTNADENQQHPTQQTSSPTESSASVMATTIAGIKPTEDIGEQEKKKPEVHVEVGIFTDGTLNNAFNSQQMDEVVERECLVPFENSEIDQAECERRLGLLMGTSYSNAPSNVAKLSDLYQEGEIEQEGIRTIRVKSYMPGPGSKTGDRDSIYGAATGLGETGVINQVHQAFQTASTLLSTRLQGRKIKSLSVDIFGFSRGAAAARHAAHEINLGHNGLFARLLKQLGVRPPENLEVRFVGLFDCVAAIVNPIAGDLTAHNNQNDPVKLFLDPEKVGHAVHLTANHEFRKLFSLNSLKNPDGSLPTNFREIALPGAHSDIGGGYPDSQREEALISPLYPIPRNRHRWPEQTSQWDNLELMREKIEAEGWIGDYSLPVEKSDLLDASSQDFSERDGPILEVFVHKQEHPAPDGRVELALRMCRQIDGGYSKVGLATMHKLAKSAGVRLKRVPEREDMALTDELKPIYNGLITQIEAGNNSPTLKKESMELLLQRYIHYSAHFNSFETLIAGLPTKIQLFRNMRPNAPTGSRERIIHPNMENA